ncbi:MAG: dihydroorotase [Gammaproteobacteria bacterium]|jgi:dihydroorotase|nr:dihydroorotase [Gammaproteobacteria bacterium]
MQEITLVRPDDWHLHLRDGAALTDTVAHTARYMGRAIVMPNLVPAVTTTELALGYRERILKQVPEGVSFDPLMTLYLTDNTSADEIRAAKESGIVYGIKLYPAGATTNSDQGVTDITRTYAALEKMNALGLPLLIHGEVTRSEIDIFDREKVFIDETLAPLHRKFPTLKIVLEHITTRDAAEFVAAAGDNIGATITPQHLMYNRNQMLVGGIRPHYYCLPILKRNAHQQALQDAVVSGSSKFFLGTDSAPHTKHSKENDCGCAGCFTAHAAIELYAEIFEELGILDKLEAFSSFNGPDFYGLPRNMDTITLRKENWTVPIEYPLGHESIVPLNSGATMRWQVIQG